MQKELTTLPAASRSARLEKNPRILVVDDNEAIHNDFRKILSNDIAGPDFDAEEAEIFGNEGDGVQRVAFDLSFAFQGQEALEKVRMALDAARRFAVVFMDVRMPPGWDGFETTKKLWEIDPDLQIVICTAYSDYSWEEIMELIGKPDQLLILKKPFDTIEVLQIAHAMTEKWALSQAVRNNMEELELAVNMRTCEYENAMDLLKLEIARHKAAAEQVREQALLLEKARDAIIVRDMDNVILFWNQGAQRLYGWTAEQAVGHKAHDLIQGLGEKGFQAILEKVLAKGSWYGELTQTVADGRKLMVESRVTLVRDDEGQPKSIFTIHTDITEKKQIESRLRQAQKLESIGQLAAGIAHEINTPTQYIGDNVRFVQQSVIEMDTLMRKYELLYQEVKAKGLPMKLVPELEEAITATDIEYLRSEVPKAVQESLQGLERVSKIVGAMKEFSHPGSDEKTLTDINRAIETTITVTRNEWKFLAEIVTDFDSSLPQIPCLPGEFNQVMLNLIINAVHAIGDVVGDGGSAKGTITISTRQSGEWVEIQVKDTGNGIPEAIQEKVFEPFFTTKPVGKGTGQGLTIAHSVVVDKHQGEITFETETGKGTTFTVRLPMKSRDSSHE